MVFPQLKPGVLLRRYKRFLADVKLDSGAVITAFVANTGSLLGCVEPGIRAWVHDTGAGTRKHRHTLALVRPRRALVCVDTGVPNRVVLEAARAQKIPALAGYREYLAEVPYGENSRADLCCRVHDRDMLRRCWVEVKSTTLCRGRTAQFPDAVTQRGLKHLRELSAAVAGGDEAVQLFFVQRGDCDEFRPADDIDPAYGEGLREAAAAGVQLLALQARVSTKSINVRRQLPVKL
ncbi:MAG TPA: DNA/RNA nuclease SfsA [Firmicutes bacterium]|nr:DNA/RNA nuclease SfsA [Bacillota bacterium]